MINLFESLDTAAIDFLRSQLFANIKIPTVVINDNGFLPDEVESPIKFYCNFTKEVDPLYFDKVKIPKFYRIVATANKGEIYDLHQKKGEIIFLANDNSRLVKEVHWLDNEGKISWVDHYNRQGKLFYKSFYNNNAEILRKYFDGNKEVITMYMQSGDIFLHDGKNTKHFSNLSEFVYHYLQQKKYNLDHIFYNSLNQTLLTSLKAPSQGSDTLFWQERLGDSLPGNLEYLIDNPTRTKHVIFQNRQDWEVWKDKLPKDKNVDFNFLGMIYPHPRGNKLRPEALVVTNSDQIEKLDEIVTAMSNIHFHIVAITEMSSKLLAFKKYKNVSLYPNALRSRIQKLYEKCDIFLDINHGNEILDANRAAFEQNMLILGFNNTIHNPSVVNPKNIFETTQVGEMVEQIYTSLEDADKMRSLIDEQRLFAGDESIKKYTEVIRELEQ